MQRTSYEDRVLDEPASGPYLGCIRGEICKLYTPRVSDRVRYRGLEGAGALLLRSLLAARHSVTPHPTRWSTLVSLTPDSGVLRGQIYTT